MRDEGPSRLKLEADSARWSLGEGAVLRAARSFQFIELVRGPEAESVRLPLGPLVELIQVLDALARRPGDG